MDFVSVGEAELVFEPGADFVKEGVAVLVLLCIDVVVDVFDFTPVWVDMGLPVVVLLS